MKTAGMSSYPIVLKDEFCIIFLNMSTDLSHTRFGTSSWAYEGWQGLLYQRPYPKSRFSQDTLTEYAGYAVDRVPLFPTVGIDHSFCQSASTRQLAYYAEQVPSTFASAQKSGKKSPSRPIRILPATEPKPGNPTHDFLIPARFGIWSGRRHPHAGSVGAPASRSDKPDRLPAPRERSGGAVDRCAAATRHPHARHMQVAPADPPALVIAYVDMT